MRMMGPLHTLKVIEVLGQGPGPHAAMMLADLGASVVTVRRPDLTAAQAMSGSRNDLNRNRREVVLNLKSPGHRKEFVSMVDQADVLIEGFRPGVMERLGLGPCDLETSNPRLIYGRMTGYGQTGPLANTAGHDLNYLAATGLLSTLGARGEVPPVPVNFIGDFGGGSTYLVQGILAAIFEREHSGRGQVVDAAIVDGVGTLGQLVWSMRGTGVWEDQREANLIDGAAPFYRCYRCSDDRFVAVGAIEPQFYDLLLKGLGLNNNELPDRMNRHSWGSLSDRFADIFATKSRDQWNEIFRDTDACVSPVLDLGEAPLSEQATARESFQVLDGIAQPTPSPRFSRSKPKRPWPANLNPEIQPAEVAAAWRSGSTLPTPPPHATG